MSRRRNYYGRIGSEDFGKKLREWRKAVRPSSGGRLTLDDAAEQLGLNMTKPGAYLSMIERGLRPIPHIALQNIPKIYGIPAEEVMKQAYWPQLSFPFLDAIKASVSVSIVVDKYLAEVEKKLDDQQKKELIQFAAFLLIKGTKYSEAKASA